MSKITKRTLGPIAMLFLAISFLGCADGENGLSPSIAKLESDQTWLVMIYFAADNNLENALLLDLEEIERVTGNGKVTVVGLADTVTKVIDGSAPGAHRILFVTDPVTKKLRRSFVGSLGEIDTGSKEVLRDFVVWADETYPRDRRALILWDHGGQWFGFGEDETSGSAMRMADIQAALIEARSTTGKGKLDCIGFDACLMSGMEIAHALAPSADWLVASAEPEGFEGWPYDTVLGALTSQNGMSPFEFGVAICNAYQSTTGNAPSATMACVDLGHVGAVTAKLGTFANALETAMSSDDLYSTIAPSRSGAEVYDGLYFESDGHPYRASTHFIDLGHLAQLVSQASEPSTPLSSASDDLLQSLGALVPYKTMNATHPEALGLSIYFPRQNPLLSAPYALESLSLVSGWDEFLLAYFGYLGPDVTAPGVSIANASLDLALSPSTGSYELTLTGQDVAIVDTFLMAVDARRDEPTYVPLVTRRYHDLRAGTETLSFSSFCYALSTGKEAPTALSSFEILPGFHGACVHFQRGEASEVLMAVFSSDLSGCSPKLLGIFDPYLLSEVKMEVGDVLTPVHQVLNSKAILQDATLGRPIVIGSEALHVRTVPIQDLTELMMVGALCEDFQGNVAAAPFATVTILPSED